MPWFKKLGVSGFLTPVSLWLTLFVTCSLDPLFIRRYKTAATKEEREGWIETAMSQRFFLSMAIGLLAMGVAWVIHPPADWWLGIWASWPLLVFTAILPAWINMAEEDMPANFRASTVAALCTAGLYMTFRPGQPAGWDVVVMAVAAVIQFFVQCHSALKRLWPLPIRWSKMRGFWPVFHEGRWLFVSGILIYVYVAMESPMLELFSSQEELGKYSAATKLIASAQQILTLVPALLFPRFVEWRKLGADVMWRKQLKLAGILFLLSAPVCVLAFVLSPMVFRLLYRGDLAESAIPFAVLFTSKVVVVFNGLFAQGLWAQAEDKKVFWVIFPTAAISFLCNIYLLPKYGMYAACSVNLFSELLVLAGCFILARQHVKIAMANDQGSPIAPEPTF